MSTQTNQKHERESRDYTWVMEVLLIACVTPAIVHGLASLRYLPIA